MCYTGVRLAAGTIGSISWSKFASALKFTLQLKNKAVFLQQGHHWSTTFSHVFHTVCSSVICRHLSEGHAWSLTAPIRFSWHLSEVSVYFKFRARLQGHGWVVFLLSLHDASLKKFVTCSNILTHFAFLCTEKNKKINQSILMLLFLQNFFWVASEDSKQFFFYITRILLVHGKWSCNTINFTN